MHRACLAMAALGLLAPHASAQRSDDDRARGHFDAGVSYFEQRRYEDAIREFDEAYRLSNRAALLLNLSVTYERLDDFDHAIEYLERYLHDEPDSPQIQTLQTRLGELRARRDRGAAPAPSGPEPAHATSGGGPSALLLGAIAVLGVGAIAGGIAIGTGIASNDRLAQLQAGCTSARVCPPELAGAIGEGQTMGIVSTIFFFTSLAAAATGITLLVLDLTSGGDRAPHTALRVGPGSIGLEGAF